MVLLIYISVFSLSLLLARVAYHPVAPEIVKSLIFSLDICSHDLIFANQIDWKLLIKLTNQSKRLSVRMYLKQTHRLCKQMKKVEKYSHLPFDPVLLEDASEH